MKILSIFIAAICAVPAGACIQDSDTLSDEIRQNPELARAILDDPPVVDPKPLRARIEKLKASPDKDDPMWWNDLAGAHLRLGEPEAAILLLNEALALFPDDYGVNANLGTAYHLTGDYAQAETFIARDLEIDPEAHFGVEKYHLALLQYLMRDEVYQMAHVYVDEFSDDFVQTREPHFYGLVSGVLDSTSPEETDPEALIELDEWMKAPGGVENLRRILSRVVSSQERPAYRTKWNLAEDPKLVDGVLYMASLNSKEPAAMTMLGVIALRDGDKNLAVAAFEKAVELGSVQAPLLEQSITAISSKISSARITNWLPGMLIGTVVVILLLIVGIVVVRIIRLRKIPKTF